MALNIQGRKVSLIGGGSLPQARAANPGVDLSGLKRLGQTLIRKEEEIQQQKEAENRLNEANIKALQNAEVSAARQEFAAKQGIADERAGLSAGYAAVGIDENGNYKPIPTLPDNTSPAYQKAFYDGFDQGMTNRFRESMSMAFIANQRQFAENGATAQETGERMRAWLDGALETAPAEYRAKWQALGQAEIDQRFGLMTSQEVDRITSARISSIQTTVTTSLDRAIGIGGAGGDPTAELATIDKAFNDLVSLGKMTPEEANLRKTKARNLIGFQAVTNRMVTSLDRGELSPESLDALAVAIETNNTEVQVPYRTLVTAGPNRGQSDYLPPKTMTSGELMAVVNDEKGRKDVGQMLRQAAAQYASEAKAVAKANEFGNYFTSLDRNTSVSSAKMSDYEKLMEGVLAKNSIEDPKSWPTISAYLMQGKVMPKVLEDQMVGAIASNDPVRIGKMVQFFNQLKALELQDGTTVGDRIASSMGTKALSQMEALSLAATSNIPLEDAIANIRKAQANDLYEVPKLIEDWNNTHEGKDSNFNSRFSQAFREAFGSAVLPDPDMRKTFTSAYGNYFAITNDREKSFELAMGVMKKQYRTSPVTINGYESGPNSLANPAGYQPWQASANLTSGSDKDWEWANRRTADIVRNAIDSGNLVLPMTEDGPMTPEMLKGIIGSDPVPVDTMTPREGKGWLEWITSGEALMPVSQNWLGKDRSAILVPVPSSNPKYPLYKVRLIRNGEDLGDLMVKDGRGGVKPMTLDLHYDRVQFEDRNARLFGADGPMTVRKQVAAANLNAQERLAELRDEITADVSTRGLTSFDPRTSTFEDYLARENPDALARYSKGRQEILEGFDRFKQEREEAAGITLPAGPLEPQALLVPRAAGPDVVVPAAKAIDAIAPDGSGGMFLARIAMQESRYGYSPGSFRLTGDRGITQISPVGLEEINRRTKIRGDRVAKTAAALQTGLQRMGIDVDLFNIRSEDLDKPIVAMAATRLYLEVPGTPLPTDEIQQAYWWKTFYNTHLGAGTVEQFLQNAKQVEPF